MYDIACTYRSYDNLIWLAISDRHLITYKNGKLLKRKPEKKYKQYAISISDLCDKWGISIETMDEIGSQYLPPPTRRKQPRGIGRPSAPADDDYKQLRLVKLFR